jgi:hypothetical protein
VKSDSFHRIVHHHRKPLIFLLLTFGSYFIYLFAQMLQVRPDGLWAGHVHVWGDWSLHIAMVNIFAYKPPAEWFAYHPYYAGGKLTYGFLTNLISAILMRLGWSLPVAMLIPSMLFGIALTIGLYAVFYQLLRSQKAAVASVVVFFCSSGLGFIRFLGDWLNNPTLESLLFPLKDYTRLEMDYQWLAGNWFTGMLIPQRAYLLGMAITVWVMAAVLWVFLRVTKHPKTALSRTQKTALVIAGVGAGILPITHMHSFIVLVITCMVFGLLTIKHWQKWLWFAVPAGLLSTVLYWQFVKGGIENPEFMQIMIGWTAPKGNNPVQHLVNWVIMWWRIWGVTIPLALMGVVVARKKLPLVAQGFLFAGFAVFALANIILFQPIQWDNSKLFMWAYFFFSPLAVLYLQDIWRGVAQSSKVLAILLFILLTGSGYMEMVRFARFDKNSLPMASIGDIQFGEQIRQNTDSQAVFLTSPEHNHPVMEWGVRPILLGYPGWAFNFGFLYRQRELDIYTMYAGGSETESLLKKYGVSYVVIGPSERYNRNMKVNEAYFTKYPLILHYNNMKVYDVRGLTGGR